MLAHLSLVYLVAFFSKGAASAWTCPSCMHQSVCKAIVDADTSALDCDDSNDLVLAAAGTSVVWPRPQMYNGVMGTPVTVDVSNVAAIKQAFNHAWVRVMATGAAHEYIIEHSGEAYRIYQANAEGPLDVKDWLSNGAAMGFLQTYADNLFGWKGTPRWAHMFNEMPQGYELRAWWSQTRALTSKAFFATAIVDKYRETWRTYGQGQLLSLTQLREWLAIPVQVGGGSAPIDPDAVRMSVQVYDYTTQQTALPCMTSWTIGSSTLAVAGSFASISFSSTHFALTSTYAFTSTYGSTSSARRSTSASTSTASTLTIAGSFASTSFSSTHFTLASTSAFTSTHRSTSSARRSTSASTSTKISFAIDSASYGRTSSTRTSASVTSTSTRSIAAELSATFRSLSLSTSVVWIVATSYA